MNSAYLIPHCNLGLAFAGLDQTDPWDKETDYPKIEKRIHELGMQNLINKENGQSIITSSRTYVESLETIMWQKADEMKKGLLFNSETDLKKAINFLETFSFYCGEKEVLYAREEGADAMYDQQKHQKIYDKRHPLSNKLNKLVKALEKANESLSSKERKKTDLPSALHRANDLVTKIYSDYLSQTDKRALQEKIGIAQDILQSFYK